MATGDALDELELECGDISASQEALLDDSSFLGGDYVSRRELDLDAYLAAEKAAKAAGDRTNNDEDEGYVSGTPSPADEPITMCSLPFTPSPSPSPSAPHAPAPPAGAEEWPDEEVEEEEETVVVKQRNKPRVRAGKVRGAKIRTPSPNPEPNVGTGEEQPVEAANAANRGGGTTHVDPLYRAVMMIPGELNPEILQTDILTLARKHGLF